MKSFLLVLVLGISTAIASVGYDQQNVYNSIFSRRDNPQSIDLEAICRSPAGGDHSNFDECMVFAARMKTEVFETSSDRQTRYEAEYPAAVNKALAYSLSKGNMVGSCKFALGSVGNTDETYQKRCEADLADKYVSKIRSNGYKARNCEEYTIQVNNKDWLSAESGMSYHPFDDSSKPVTFFGTVTQADQKKIAINLQGSNALITIDAHTNIFQPKKIAIGTMINGIGIPVRGQAVTLTSGEQTTIPVIAAFCLEGHQM